MAERSYKVGDWFAIPLRSDGYALGVVARSASNGVLLGYFFGPKYARLPTLADAAGLSPDRAAFVAKFGDLALKRGTWTVLGTLNSWDRQAWPIPVFVRYEELSGRTFRVVYADDNPNRVIREELVAAGDSVIGPPDALLGAGYVEKVLTSTLDGR